MLQAPHGVWHMVSNLLFLLRLLFLITSGITDVIPRLLSSGVRSGGKIENGRGRHVVLKTFPSGLLLTKSFLFSQGE